MATVARLSLLLVVLLTVLSAYLRLDHSGIGCQPWPACYGNIGLPAASADAAKTYERLLEEASEPLSWATPLHRLVASVLGFFILGLTLMSVATKRNRPIAFLLLGLTVFLAWLGIYSEGLHSPAVVMGNLSGGFAMLGLLGWLVVRAPGRHTEDQRSLRRVTTLALVLLGLQVLVGGLTSANFAASACTTLPDCQGAWLPGTEILSAFDLTRVHQTDASGIVQGGAERAAIHQLHRILAVFAAAGILFAGIAAIRAKNSFTATGIAVVILVLIEFALGVAAVVTAIPIPVAVAHNWVAALLLLALLKLLADSQASSA